MKQVRTGKHLKLTLIEMSGTFINNKTFFFRIRLVHITQKRGKNVEEKKLITITRENHIHMQPKVKIIN